jgi:hypothetical protein
LLLLFISNCKWGFTRWQWYCNKTTHKYTCISNTHITQNKTIEVKIRSQKESALENNLLTHKIKDILQPMNIMLKKKKLKLFLSQAIEAY